MAEDILTKITSVEWAAYEDIKLAISWIILNEFLINHDCNIFQLKPLQPNETQPNEPQPKPMELAICRIICYILYKSWCIYFQKKSLQPNDPQPNSAKWPSAESTEFNYPLAEYFFCWIFQYFSAETTSAKWTSAKWASA